MERNERNNQANKSEYTEKLVHLGKVTKVVKGGKNMRWNALVVVGDENGHVGAGMGKAAEVPDAVRKAVASAKKNMITVPMVGTTIPHEIIGTYGAGTVLLKPAGKGTGVIAGGAARAVVELAGIKDIRTKSLRSNNPGNVVMATMEALRSLVTVDDVAAVRGKSADEIL